MSKKSFVYGALVLLSSSLFNRILGFVYQVTMIRLVRPEGIGLFNMVYPVYILVLVSATVGIPVAISKLVAEETAVDNLRGAYRIFKICFFILTANSMLFTVLCCAGSHLLLEYIFPNPNAYHIFLSLLPGIIIVSLCSAFRGFFQGLQNMVPTAVSQSLEQLVRVFSGIFFAYIFLPFGIEFATIGASIGVVAGELSGLLSMVAFYFRNRPNRSVSPSFYSSEPLSRSLARIFNLAFPVTLSRLISSLLLSVDAVLIPQRLQAGGLNLADSTSTFGQFVGIAETLLFTPGIITVSLAVSLIPAVSDAMAINNMSLVRARCEDAIRITFLAGLPCACIFFTLSEELCGIIFGYPEAGASLKILALGGLFLYLQQTTTGILQGMGQAARPFRNLVFASFFKIIGIYYLTSIPQLGIRGTAAAFVACYAIMAWLNLLDIFGLTGIRINFTRNLLKPLFSSTGMALATNTSKHYFFSCTGSTELSTAFSLILGLLSYLSLLIFSGGINGNDIRRIKNVFSLRTRY